NPLDQVSRLRAAGAAVSVGRHLVGEHAHLVELEGWDFVAAWCQESGECWNHGREKRQESTEIGNGFDPHAQNRPVFFQCQLDIVDLIAPMNGRGNVLAAAFDPFHWASGLFRQIADKTILGVQINFAPEPSSVFPLSKKKLKAMLSENSS